MRKSVMYGRVPSSMRATSSKQRLKHSVVPGPAEGRSPGTITTGVLDQITTRRIWTSGSLAALGPRNDVLRFAGSASSMAETVIYAGDVI